LRIQSAIDSTAKLKKELVAIDKWLILAQDKLINAQSNVKDVIDYLDKKAQDFRGNLFILDEEPLWKWEVSKKTNDFWNDLSTSYADQQRILFLFFEDYSWQFIFHFLVFIGLIWFFLFLKKKYANADFPGDDQRIKLAKITINYPITSAVILGFMISIYYYQSAPSVVFSLLTFLVAFPIIILFPNYVNIKSRRFLYLVIAVYFVQEIQELIIVDHLMNRYTQIIKASIIIYVLSIALKKQKEKNDGFGNRYWQAIIKFLGPVFLFLAIGSVISNFFGAYRLSEVLVTGVINASTYAIIFMIYGILIASVFIIVLRSKYASSIQKFTKDNAKFELRVSGLIYLYMLYLWIKSTLVSYY